MEEKANTPHEIKVSDLTVYTVEEIKREIDKYLENDESFKLVFENISGIDLTYIQLILSLQSLEEGKKLRYEFRGDIPDEIINLLVRTGFSDILIQQNPSVNLQN
jgi:hypothetical protein